MALVLGTNCGFVTVAPTTDPLGELNLTIDNAANAFKVTAPSSGDLVVTEIGWWCNNATQAANFEVGIYTDAGNEEPEALIGKSSATAKGTAGMEWKKATVDIAISPNTVYWIAVQLDNTFTNTFSDKKNATGLSAYKTSQTTLPSDWGTSTVEGTDLFAIYAVWEEAAAGTNIQINIADAWKAVSAMQINIGDAWKTVAGAQVNIGDAWKTIF